MKIENDQDVEFAPVTLQSELSSADVDDAAENINVILTALDGKEWL